MMHQGEVQIPLVAEGMTHGVLRRWLVATGDRVERGQSIFELETDDAVWEIESFDSGTITLLGIEGESYEAGAKVGSIECAEEERVEIRGVPFYPTRAGELTVMSKPAASGFDLDAVAVGFVGTWSFPEPGETPVTGWLHFTDGGRAIQFVPNLQRPEKPMGMRLWYSVESEGQLRFRPRPEHEGWLRDYRLEGDTLTLGTEGRTWVCTRASAEEIPGWFHESLAAALAK